MRELEELYRSIAPKLLSYLRRLTGNAYLAEELLQQTFLHATEHLLVSNRELKPAWFYTVARHLYLDEIRRGRRLQTTEGIETYMDEADSPAEQAERHEARFLLHKALQQLPENYRTLLILREFNELSYQEIAEIAGLSLDQVKVGIFRARQSLRKLMEREDPV